MIPRLKIGTVDYVPTYIKSDERFTHILLLGKSGTGKSTFIENCWQQDSYFKNAMILIEPHDRLPDTLLDTRLRLEPQLMFGFLDIGKRLGHIPGLHRQKILIRLRPELLLDQSDEIHELDGLVPAEVIDLVPPRRIQRAQHRRHHVLDEREIPTHLPVPVHIDRLLCGDLQRELVQRHVRPPPGPVDREEPQPGHRQLEQMMIDMRHELIGFLRRGIERDRVIHAIRFRERDLDVPAIDRR